MKCTGRLPRSVVPNGKDLQDFRSYDLDLRYDGRMTVERCTKTPGVACGRKLGHRGCCTARPSAKTLDWDRGQEWHIAAAVDLLILDLPTPRWADLLDEDAA